MEAFRTFLIWLTQLAIFYGLTVCSDPEIRKFRMAGEQWANGSWAQLIGFALTTISMLVYNGITQCPCFNYAAIFMKSEEDNDFQQQQRMDANRMQKNEEGDIHIVSEAGSNSDGSLSSDREGLTQEDGRGDNNNSTGAV
jgi:hypothetical protein